MIDKALSASDKDARIERLEKALEEAMVEIARLRKIVEEQAKIIEEWKRGHRKRGRRTRKEKRGARQLAPKDPGRKPGHDGAFRPPPDRVDDTEHHHHLRCLSCGSEARATGQQRDRYREEILPVERRVIKEVDHETQCLVCGHRQWSRPQPPPSGSTVLGPSVVAFAATMRFHLKMSWHDTAKLLSEHAGVRVTAGGLTQLFARLAVRLRPVVAEIKREALALSFLHLDETSWYQSGSLRWLWIVSHPSLSFFHVDKSRGREVAQALLTNEADELFAGIAVTDFYAVYRYMEGLDHQYCWPHLVRDARKLLDIDGGPLTERFLSMLVSIYHDGKRAQEREDAGQRHGIRVRLGKLVADTELASHPGIARLQRRIDEEFQQMLTFLDMPGLPADNNQGERDLRPSVILRKISFQTRSERGSRTMADMMSVAQTARKKSVPLGPFIAQALDAHCRGRAPPSLFAER